MAAATGRRIHLLDELRGALIIYVVLYHLLYNFSLLFPEVRAVLYSEWVNLLRDVLTGMLIGICGISCRLSHSNWVRGAKILLCGMAVTLATYLAAPQMLITFGILHLMGICVLLYALTAPLLHKLPVLPGFLVSALLFFLTKPLSSGYLQLPFWRVALKGIPDRSFLLFALGFPTTAFSSSDYYPLIPWMFLFFCGVFIGAYFRAGTLPAPWYKRHSRFLSYLGCHTLPIYLCHQPIFFAGFWLYTVYFT